MILRQGRTKGHPTMADTPMTMAPSLNVLGDPLEPCSVQPLTGFFRNGACDTCAADTDSHTVCAVMTAEFLAYSAYVGNDLSTPNPQYGFAGLRPGDRWCLCAGRFLQAWQVLVIICADAVTRISLRSPGTWAST